MSAEPQLGSSVAVRCNDTLGGRSVPFEHVEAGGQDGNFGQRPGKRKCSSTVVPPADIDHTTRQGPSACRTSALITLSVSAFRVPPL